MTHRLAQTLLNRVEYHDSVLLKVIETPSSHLNGNGEPDTFVQICLFALLLGKQRHMS